MSSDNIVSSSNSLKTEDEEEIKTKLVQAYDVIYNISKNYKGPQYEDEKHRLIPKKKAKQTDKQSQKQAKIINNFNSETEVSSESRRHYKIGYDLFINQDALHSAMTPKAFEIINSFKKVDCVSISMLGNVHIIFNEKPDVKSAPVQELLVQDQLKDVSEDLQYITSKYAKLEQDIQARKRSLQAQSSDTTNSCSEELDNTNDSSKPGTSKVQLFHDDFHNLNEQIQTRIKEVDDFFFQNQNKLFFMMSFFGSLPVYTLKMIHLNYYLLQKLNYEPDELALALFKSGLPNILGAKGYQFVLKYIIQELAKFMRDNKASNNGFSYKKFQMDQLLYEKNGSKLSVKQQVIIVSNIRQEVKNQAEQGRKTNVQGLMSKIIASEDQIQELKAADQVPTNANDLSSAGSEPEEEAQTKQLENKLYLMMVT